MTDAIKALIKSNGLLTCPFCEGSGEINSFCGHESSEICYMCRGNGIIKSLTKQKHRETCIICNGKGCAGGCDWKGYHEWESYELFGFPANDNN